MLMLGQKLRLLRRRAGMTQEQLARLLAISPATVSYYEKGLIVPPLEKLKQIANIFSISVSELLEDGIALSFVRSTAPPSYRELPVYDGAEAGCKGKFPDQAEVVEVISVPGPSKAQYGVIVYGDSMEPEIRNRDIVLVNPNLEIHPGDRVLVQLDDVLFVKVYNKQGKYVCFTSLNRSYPPIVVEDTSEIKYMAKVVGVVRWYT